MDDRKRTKRIWGKGIALGAGGALLLVSGLALAASLSKESKRRPGALTVTAVFNGLTLSAQTAPTYHAKLTCDLGYRVKKLGAKTYPLNQRIVEEDVPGGLLAQTRAGEFHTACKGGHAAIEVGHVPFQAKCEKVKVTWEAVAKAPFVYEHFGQYDLRCENVPLVGIPNPKRALRLYWNGKRGDNFTAATSSGYGAAASAGYSYARIEGQLFSKSAEGLVPMKLYWNAERGDNMSVVTKADEDAAKTAGYKYVRTQGYLYPANANPVPKGTLPLELYWHSGRGDNISVAHPDTKASVGAYTRVRLQGYILKVPRPEELDANGRYK